MTRFGWRRAGPAHRAVVAALALQIGCSARPEGRDRESPSASSSPAATTGPASAARGKSIYLDGISPAGRPIRARLGGSTDVPAAVLTCGNCHGRDGAGRPEGGIKPAAVTWDELTKDYGPNHPSGRRRPAYTERSVRVAITEGIDPSGRSLDASMPRYALAREDMDDLVAYLNELGRDSDPGITDRTIHLATVLAPPGSLGAMNRAVRSALAAYFEELNDRGGIYGRRVEVRWFDAADAPDERAEEVRQVMARGDTFALLAPFIAGAEDEVAEAAVAAKMPVLGPLTLYPRSEEPPNRYVFYLHAGLADQLRALAAFAGDRLAGRKPSVAIVVLDGDNALTTEADVLRDECHGKGWGPVEMIPVSRDSPPEPIADHLVRSGAGVAFVLAPDWRGVRTVADSAPRDNPLLLLMPGALAGPVALGAMGRAPDRLFLSYPTLPLDSTRAGTAEYERLAAAHGLPREHRSTQVAALAAAKLFVEALTAAGRAAGREDLIDRWEHYYEQPTGLTRPVTFGPNRRFGTRGAYIMGIDPDRTKLVPVSGFIEPGPHSP